MPSQRESLTRYRGFVLPEIIGQVAKEVASHGSEALTREYRRWCQKVGLEVADPEAVRRFMTEGPGPVGENWPFPFESPWKCRDCGLVSEREQWQEVYVRQPQWRDGEFYLPHTFVWECPECGSWRQPEVPACPDCGYWPCCCDDEERDDD